ncbi:MAG: ribonuclease R [bacterium]
MRKKYFRFNKMHHQRKQAAAGKPVQGVLQLRGRFGFVLSEEPGKPDIYVAGPSLRQAMDGDLVQVSLIPGRRREGKIISVVKRSRTTAVGILRKLKDEFYIVPEDDSSAPVRVINSNGFTLKLGQAGVVRITQWPEGFNRAGGELIEVLGWPDQDGIDLKMILHKAEFNECFPNEVIREAESLSEHIPDHIRKSRKSFFHLPVFTIDGSDSKDFDDAVSLEKRSSGNVRLGVHIADVAEYVGLGSPLDKEAALRTTSIYPAGKVVPMLPAALSENICSLLPARERLTLSCIMDIDSHGEVKNYEITETIIKSTRRFTYEEFNELLAGHQVNDALGQAVYTMGILAKKLNNRRMKRGALDFDFPESKVIVDEKGKPTNIVKVERLESHRLIEEFMLLANETVALHLENRHLAALYRIHEKPQIEKLIKLTETLHAFGIQVPQGFTEGSSKALGRVLNAVEGKPYQNLIDRQLLRTFSQAVYSTVNKGHFGLAADCYTHFTSPIRRYPDLCVHRIFKAQINDDRSSGLTSWYKTVPQIAVHASSQERKAQSVEWEYTKLKKVQFMKDKQGEIFKGVISSVVSFGFFVELTEYQVEGLVHVETLEDDFYEFDEAKLLLCGRKTKNRFHSGQEVKVLLSFANETKRQLDFQYIA